MTRSRLGMTLALRALALIPEGTARTEGGRHWLLYVLAGLLVLAALYLIGRMIEWDKMNEETPNQDDPLTRDREEP